MGHPLAGMKPGSRRRSIGPRRYCRLSGWRVESCARAATGSAISSATSSPVVLMRSFVTACHWVLIFHIDVPPLARRLYSPSAGSCTGTPFSAWPSEPATGGSAARAERGVQHLLHAIDEHERQLAAHLLGDVVDVGARCACGRMIVRMPARWAASTFSLMPPIGSTLPRSVISPVIATSVAHRPAGQQRGQRGGHRDARPTAHPSAPRRPAHACGSRACRRTSGRSPARSASARTHEQRRLGADSLITSPSWPVSVKPLPPGMPVASMKIISPPTGVQTRPVTMPGRSIRSLTSV